MTCDEVHARSLPEEYLAGRLPGDDQEAYERHFFECERCFADLEALRATAAALQPARARVSSRTPPGRWMGLAAVLAIAVGTAVFLVRGRSAAPADVTATAPASPPSQTQPATPQPGVSESLRRLARFEPPPYTPPRLRSAPPADEFRKGMERYAQRDYTAAIPLLQSAIRNSSDADTARLYLGVSLVIAEKPEEAVRALEPLSNEPANVWAEDARLFSAYAYLQQGDAERAAAALDRTIALHGDREEEARRLRDELEKVARTR